MLPTRRVLFAADSARCRKAEFKSTARTLTGACEAKPTENVPGPQPISMAVEGSQRSAHPTSSSIWTGDNGFACGTASCAAAEIRWREGGIESEA